MLDMNDIFWTIFNYINILIYFVLYSLFIGCLSKKKLLFLFIISIISFLIKDNNILVYILSCSIFYKLNYNKNILICIFSSSIYWIIIYRASENIISNLIYLINYSNIFKGNVIDTNIVIIESIVLKIILIIILYVIYSYIIRVYRTKKIFNMIIFIPILTNFLSILIVFRYTALNNNIAEINNFKLVIMPSIILISNIIFFIILKKIVQSYSIKYENKILKNSIIKEYDKYLNIKKEQDKVKAIYHDIKNHMICMRDMCENNKMENVINYIDNIELELKKYNINTRNFNTGNLVIDSILKNKKALCEEKLIDFDIDIDFSKIDFIDMTDVCIIFSNIIDNAIEACSKINLDVLEKKIRLESKCIENFCIIVIENTKVNKIIEKNKKFITSKNNPFSHGIGLTNVKKVVSKYSGEIKIEYYETKFILKIMIPC